MRVRTLEIRWHDSKPIATADFQPIPPKRARPATANDRAWTQQTYRLATGGEDNHVRVSTSHPCLNRSFVPSTITRRHSQLLCTCDVLTTKQIWLVHPNILPPAVAADSASGSEPPPAPRAPRVEYVATLSRHSAAVNVVRFSPNGQFSSPCLMLLC